MSLPTTSPAESGALRWGQRSVSTATVPSCPRKIASGSSQIVRASGFAPTSVKVAAVYHGQPRARSVVQAVLARDPVEDARPDIPLRGVQRNREHKRRRYLSTDELTRLTHALDEHPNRQAADVFRLLLLTGARKHEVLSATWQQFDLAEGTWTKPAATTKQRTEHQVPLSAPARQLLARRREQGKATTFVFPGP